MSLTWKLGTFRISAGRKPGETSMDGIDRWAQGERQTEERTGLVSEPVFGLYREHSGYSLTSLQCHGFRVADSSDFVKLLRFAELVSGLDWTGDPGEVSARNSNQVRRAKKEVGL